MKNILGILILPFGLLIIALLYIWMQIKYFVEIVRGR